MTHTTNQTLTDVHDMVVVHRAFRRELGTFPVLVRAVRPGHTARATLLAGHARMMLKGLHLHHTSEDELLWPKLLERATLQRALVERMEAQHEQVHDHLERLGPALDRWQAEARPAVTDEVAGIVESLAAVLWVHLDEEEREILPLAARHITQQEWDELGEHGIAQMSRSELPLLFGAVLEEATPDETAHLVSKLPLPARLLLRPVILPQYRRYTRRLRQVP
jgi:iron-sulfur cluster repair protein YtfE (RIC family)